MSLIRGARHFFGTFLCVLGFTLRSGLLQVFLDVWIIEPLAGSAICGPLGSLVIGSVWPYLEPRGMPQHILPLALRRNDPWVRCAQDLII